MTRLTALALSTVVASLAGYALHPVIEPGPLLPVVLVAATIPTALVAVWGNGRRRPSLWLTAPATAAAWLVVVTATVLRASATASFLPNATTLGLTADGLRDSWRDVLATIPPVTATPGVLVAVHGLVWLTAAVSAEVLSRTRVTMPALLPSLALLFIALLTVAGEPGSDTVVVVGWLLAALLLLLLRRDVGARPASGPGRKSAEPPPPACGVVRSAGPAGSARRLTIGAALAALVTLTAALLGPLPVAHREPLDVRRYLAVPSAQQPAVDPLAQVSAWLATPDLALFQVRASSAQNWRLAVLDQFDGALWSTGARFVATSSRVPAQPSTLGSDAVVQHVTIDALTGVWLPAAESPTRITGTTATVDPRSGVLLSPAGLRPALQYDVTSAAPRLEPGPLRSAVPATDPAALVVAPGLPPVLADTARTATAGANSPYQQATRLATYLQSNASYDAEAPPGHTYGHLANFLDVSHRGTSEQFATGFAVMARTLGLPTRVVIGFRSGLPVAPGQWRVVGADVLVWPEVEFAGIGWIPFYPTPDTAAPNGTVTPAGSSSVRQRLDESLNIASAPDTTQPVGAGTHGFRPAPPITHSVRWIAWAGVCGFLGYLVLVLVLPVVRTSARRRGYHVPAAWSQAMQWLQPAVVADLAPLTVTEVARRTSAVIPAVRPDLTALSDLADLAAFSGQPTSAEQGREAWRRAMAIRRHASRAVSWPTRLRHRLSIRRLWS